MPSESDPAGDFKPSEKYLISSGIIRAYLKAHKSGLWTEDEAIDAIFDYCNKSFTQTLLIRLADRLEDKEAIG